ncbi:lamin tail domain-containing protein [Algoriphagus aestuarii]|nr:lamin tail domain-containing protein [Algoriphagus aestuarii]
MKLLDFLNHIRFLIIWLFIWPLILESNAQTQGFENSFLIVSNPDEFLPNWYANEVRSTNSRVFQAKDIGVNESNCLAVQPISTFNGEVVVKLDLSGFNNPKIRFWSKSIQNGSGNRPAEVYYSWSTQLNGVFSHEKVLGSKEDFKNENQDFRMYQISIPSELQGESHLFLKFEIRYGEGTGTCARWLMDDFEFGDLVEDTIAPKVEIIRGFHENQIQIVFSESVEPVSSLFIWNYQLEDMNPESTLLQSDSSVVLTFTESLIHGKQYQLSFSQIPDLLGNFLADTTIRFDFYNPTLVNRKSLVINEIMPAPRAGLDLPNVEYVELLNTENYSIRTTGMTWSNSRSSTSLSDTWIEPDEYVILIPANQQESMTNFGKLIPINSWPTLLNAGDLLSLKSQNGEAIDQISYSSASWESTEKASSGYSLEVVNPFLLCDQSELLKTSTAILRGTPGLENSVFDQTIDQNPPVLTSILFLDSLTVQASFSEPINFEFETDLWLSHPVLVFDSVYQQTSVSILIQLKEPAMPSVLYRLTLEGIGDCSGNKMQSKEFEIILPASPAKGEVLINELLFNPKTGRPKFVELFNASEKYIDVGQLKLGNLDENNQVDQVKPISQNGMILPPKSYLAITTDTFKLRQDFPKSILGMFTQVSSLPSYPIVGGTVVLLDESEQALELFPFNEDLHHPLLRDPKGVSLERISILSDANLNHNWHSASGNEDYGTPGRKNSQVFEGGFDKEVILISPEVFDPEGSNGQAFATISYQLEQSGWVGSFEIYDLAGRLIHVLDRNAILGSSGLYTWEGTDDMGVKVPPGYYVLMVEVFDLQGSIQVFKKTIVVATRL